MSERSVRFRESLENVEKFRKVMQKLGLLFGDSKTCCVAYFGNFYELWNILGGNKRLSKAENLESTFKNVDKFNKKFSKLWTIC